MVEDNGPKIYSLSIVAMVLCWIFIGLRLFVRVGMKKSFAWDDAFAVLCLVFFTACLASVIYGVESGIGRHMAELTPDQISHSFMAYLFAELFYALSTWFIKISFSWTLLRIVTGRNEPLIIYSVMFVTTALSLFFFFFVLLSCKPIDYFWRQFNDSSATGTCRSMSAVPPVVYAHGVGMILSDVILTVLPARVVWHLNMSRQSKFSVIFLLALGSLTSVATIIRIPYISQLGDKDDFTFKNVDITIWSIVEIVIAIITTSASTLRPLAMRLNLFSSNHSKDASTNNHHRMWSTPLGSSNHKASRNRKITFDDGKRDIPIRSLRRRSDHGFQNGHGGNVIVTIDDSRDPYGRGLANHEGRSRNGSSEEIVWEGKHAKTSITSESRPSEDDAESHQSIPNGQIQKVVEFSTTTELRQ